MRTTFATESERQLAIYMKERATDAAGGGGSPSSQPALEAPRLDPEAREMIKRLSSLDLKGALPALGDSSTPWAEIGRLLLALHHKFWHASAPAMFDLVEGAGVPKAVLGHIEEIIPRKCKRCMQFAHAKRYPKVKTSTGRFLNRVL